MQNKDLKHLEKVCFEYCMSAEDVYNILLSKNDEEFPLSFETVKYKVLKDISCEALKNIFTQEELKSIFADSNLKKIKNKDTRKFIKSLT